MIRLATSNKNKVKEYIDLGSNLEFGLCENSVDVIENGTTFLENAFIKANNYHSFNNECVLSDDSGLEIEALNNFPGIFSSRFAYPIVDYKKKCELILEMLKDKENRRARFSCAIVIIDKDGTKYSAVGHVYGTIANEYKGNKGFGYDPIFIPDGYNLTFGELGEEIKNKISHRANAFKNIYEKLPIKFIRRHSKHD